MSRAVCGIPHFFRPLQFKTSIFVLCYHFIYSFRCEQFERTPIQFYEFIFVDYFYTAYAQPPPPPPDQMLSLFDSLKAAADAVDSAIYTAGSSGYYSSPSWPVTFTALAYS